VLSYRIMPFSVDSPNEGTVIVFIGHKLLKCKRRAFNNGGNNGNSRDKKYAFKLKKKKVQNNKPSSYNGNDDPRRDLILMVNRSLNFKIHLISFRKQRFVPLLVITNQKSYFHYKHLLQI
jgi:hypothetical protein